MTNEQTAMILYPPGLSDEEAFVVGEFLHELTSSFERNYAQQLKRHYAAMEQWRQDQQQNNQQVEPINDTDEYPF
jgi:tRNA A22 N-methylase